MRALSTAAALGGWLCPLDALRVNPVPVLLEANDAALTWAVRHDILGEDLEPRALWSLREPRRAAAQQQADGSWTYPGRRTRLRSSEDYDQLETFSRLLWLTGKYRWDRHHPAFGAAAEFLLSHQSDEGDLRGIYGRQYATTYTGAITAVLVDGGYGGDRRVRRALDWLLATRQDDGGWVVPLRTMRGSEGSAYTRAMRLQRPVAPDRARPSSHLVTGMALRALAAHPRYRDLPATRAAATLLASRFFQRDRYPDRTAVAYWTKLAYPFRWTDIVSSLDAIGRIGIGAENPHVSRAIDWLLDAQGRDGLWRSGYGSTPDPLVHHWVTFAVARALLRFG